MTGVQTCALPICPVGPIRLTAVKTTTPLRARNPPRTPALTDARTFAKQPRQEAAACPSIGSGASAVSENLTPFVARGASLAHEDIAKRSSADFGLDDCPYQRRAPVAEHGLTVRYEHALDR